MKIIEALKKIKHLDRKVEKTSKRVSEWCSYINDKENPVEPVYDREDINRMLQQIDDWTNEKARLRHLLHRTNVEKTVNFWGKTYTIDELLGIKEVVIPQQINVRKSLRRREKGHLFGGEYKTAVVINQFDSKQRDQVLDSLENQREELDALIDQLSIEIDIVE